MGSGEDSDLSFFYIENKSILLYNSIMKEEADILYDLFKIAAENSTQIADRFNEIKNKSNTEEKTILENFADFVKENWGLSINLKKSELISVLVSETYKNMYRVIEDDANELKQKLGITISIEETAKKSMGTFYEPRKIFEDSFVGGNHFLYSALNIGGMGLKKHGRSFSIIIHQSNVSEFPNCAFLKDESIRYIENGKPNIGRLSNDTSDRQTIHLMTAIKNKKSLLETKKENWPGMVCSEENYIEAITPGEIPIKCINTVRIAKQDDDWYYDMLFNARTISNRVDESDLRHLNEYGNLLKLLKKNGIDKEIIYETGN